MEVKLLVSRVTSGAAENRGDIIDVPDDEAIRMIEVGQAEPVREGRKPEKATKRAKTEKAKK